MREQDDVLERLIWSIGTAHSLEQDLSKLRSRRSHASLYMIEEAFDIEAKMK